MNEIGRVRLQLGESIVADPYRVLPETGRMILINPADNNTAAAVIVRDLSRA
jgi:sulfate adenylyltransferase subunit 1 (EFTu-like GTPase family)